MLQYLTVNKVGHFSRLYDEKSIFNPASAKSFSAKIISLFIFFFILSEKGCIFD